MNLSLSMWSVNRTVSEKRWTVLDFLAFCKEENITGVELLDVFWQDIESELEEVIRYTTKHGIHIVSYAVSNNFAQENPDDRLTALNKIVNGIQVAKKLGTSIIRVFAGNLRDGVTYENGKKWILQGLTKASEAAAQENVLLCLENHGMLAGKGVQMKEIIEHVESPFLQVTVDVGNFLLVDDDPSEAVRLLLPQIKHVHIKDFKEESGGIYKSLSKRDFIGASPGDGDVDLQSIMKMLQTANYSGAYVLEYEGEGDEIEGIRRSYQNFERIRSGIR